MRDGFIKKSIVFLIFTLTVVLRTNAFFVFSNSLGLNYLYSDYSDFGHWIYEPTKNVWKFIDEETGKPIKDSTVVIDGVGYTFGKDGSLIGNRDFLDILSNAISISNGKVTIDNSENFGYDDEYVEDNQESKESEEDKDNKDSQDKKDKKNEIEILKKEFVSETGVSGGFEHNAGKYSFFTYDAAGNKRFLKKYWINIRNGNEDYYYATNDLNHMVTGFYNIDGKIYYFIEDGIDKGQMATGFTIINDETFVFDDNGKFIDDLTRLKSLSKIPSLNSMKSIIFNVKN